MAQPSEKNTPRTTQATKQSSQTETSKSQHQQISRKRSIVLEAQQALQHSRDLRITHPVPTESLLYFLGALCMAWSGSSPHCTRKNCPKCLQHTTTLLLRVFLPSWLLAKALIGSISYTQSRGLSLHLRFPSVRPSGAEIFELVSLGDLAGIQYAFKTGTASVWDVDLDGNGLLWYALTAFNEHMTPTCRLLLSCGIDLLSEDSNPSGRLYATSIHVWRLIARQRVATEKATSLNMLSKSWLANSPVRDIMTRMESDVELPWVLKKKWEGSEQPVLYAEPGYYHGDFFFARASGNGYVTEAVLHNNERALRRLLQMAESSSSSSHNDNEDEGRGTAQNRGEEICDVVQLLSSPSLDLELPNSYGLTALHYAILYNRTPCLPLLLRAGANCAAVSQHSYNILHFAAIAATTQTLVLLARAPVLRNAEQVPVPRVDLHYIKAVRQRVGAISQPCLGDEEWWQAWEKVLGRFGGGEGDGKRVDELWDGGLPFPGPAVRRVFC
ncbi:hypothetical protein BCR34DRAFT_375241 [Clohesyomyces aquaticus]|uniref:Uncharacterized protein n=1 Tax=Clohesyomyces aquaticus TaxID=1231657 RepID=A0A1Y1ZGG0_9PLEO|nr:hypothetical protein BCR34DRAFT_375241 [Clohesyomyces aquaticus]